MIKIYSTNISIFGEECDIFTLPEHFFWEPSRYFLVINRSYYCVILGDKHF